MAQKRHTPEQIIRKLREVEVAQGKGKTTPQAVKQISVTEQTFYRWRKEYGGMRVDQAKRLKELEKENLRLKRLVAETQHPQDIRLRHQLGGRCAMSSMLSPLLRINARRPRRSSSVSADRSGRVSSSTCFSSFSGAYFSMSWISLK